MVTVPSFKSSSVQHDVYFVNSHPTQGEIDERMWGMSLDVATLWLPSRPPSRPNMVTLAPTNQDGDDLNAKLKAWTGNWVTSRWVYTPCNHDPASLSQKMDTWSQGV